MKREIRASLYTFLLVIGLSSIFYLGYNYPNQTILAMISMSVIVFIYCVYKLIYNSIGDDK